MAKLRARVGNQHADLTIIRILSRSDTGVDTRYEVICACGAIFTLAAGNFKKQISCAACAAKRIPKSRLTHGAARRGQWEPLYKTWRGMRARCRNPNHTVYRWYGGKGVKVCAEWSDFAAFRTWAFSNGYRPGLSIDRRDTAANYSPENCQWVTRSSNSKRIVEIANA